MNLKNIQKNLRWNSIRRRNKMMKRLKRRLKLKERK
jgi:hypothetical protein